MILNRHLKSNYYICDDPSIKVFVYSNLNQSTFSLKDAFNGMYPTKFLIVFYRGGMKYNSSDYFDSNLRKNKVIWLNSFDNPISNTTLDLNDDLELIDFINFEFGNDQYQVYPIKKKGNCKLIYDEFSNCIIGNNLKGYNSLKILNPESEINSNFNKFYIPLIHKEAINNYKTSLDDNFGYMVFQTSGIQPATPYILSKKNNQSLTHVHYFDSITFGENVDTICSISPFNEFYKNNVKDKSYLEYYLKTGRVLKSKFLDEHGNNFVVNQLNQIKSVLGLFSKYQNVDHNYIFMPDHDSKITLIRSNQHSNSGQMLLGNSGTEMVETQDNNLINIKFKIDKEIIVHYEKNKFLDSFESITSIPEINFQKPNYYLDAERAPLFKNESINDNVSKVFESMWNPLKIGKLKENRPNFRIIPILEFKSQVLKDIDVVFSHLRKGYIDTTSIQNKNILEYITPQGFLKKDHQLDFIKEETSKINSGQLNNNKFKIKSDFDFDISISSEDVLFIVTPKMLEENADIKFNIGKFEINLDLYKIESENDSQQIIIFKYGKFKLEELIQNISKWSNYGKYNNDQTQLETIKNNVNNIFNSFKEKEKTDDYKQDYKYVVRKVLKDINWNGVLILNIPLGKDTLPDVLRGLSSSNKLSENFNEKLKIQYIALPINKTRINNGAIDIVSSSFYGLIDYDLFEEQTDKDEVKLFLQPDEWRLILTKLLVRFENSEIVNYLSYAFLKAPKGENGESFFEDKVKINPICLSHLNESNCDEGSKLDNLFKLKGYYQKSSNNDDEFIFDIESDIEINFDVSNKFLNKINVDQASFAFVKGDTFRFDFDGKVIFKKDIEKNKKLISFNSLEFKNIGVLIETSEGVNPGIRFDHSRLKVLPEILFNEKGFFNSFPIKFNSFKVFDSFNSSDYFDFIKIDGSGSLFGLVFDLDLGTLGELSLLKSLKGKILLGWTKGGGFKLGFKFNKSKGLHINLGAIKLDIEDMDLCSYEIAEKAIYFLRLNNIKLTLIGTKLPDDDKKLNGIIFAEKNSKVAWFLSVSESKKEKLLSLANKGEDKLLLGVGQRVGPELEFTGVKTVSNYIEQSRSIFNAEFDDCSKTPKEIKKFYKPNRNWLVASEKILPDSWDKILDFKFIFNDPVLYGAYLELKNIDFSIDITYAKLSDNLGVWALEIQLPESYRNIEMGAASVTIPNIGIEIYTNGSWKIDIGFPNGNDYSRSCIIQILPFIGFAGFYLMRAKSSSITLFKNHIPDQYTKENLNILQAGMALRIGIGKYINKGIFQAHASLTVFGILEGAFAFEKRGNIINQIFPDHYAMLGRVGAIAEIEGRVSFRIIAARVYVVLRVEIGMFLVYLSKDIPNGSQKGLQPVNLYIEGSVHVGITVTIACFKIWRKRICIRVHFSFSTTVRFEYTLGGNSSSKSLPKGHKLLGNEKNTKINISIDDIKYIPMTYVPAVTQTENSKELIHGFSILFFGKEIIEKDKKKTIVFSENNIFSDTIKKIFCSIESALVAEGISNNYENIRSILLNGNIIKDDVIYEIDIKFPNYRPLLIKSNTKKGEDPVSKESIIKYFHFSPVEAEGFVFDDKLCRTVSAPISSSITVLDENYSSTDQKNITDITNFKVKITNLIDNETPVEIKEDQDELSYTESQIKEIEDYFEFYKSNVGEEKQTRDDKKKYNIRQELIIPEFFKLLSLVTLEEYFNVGFKNVHMKEETFKGEAKAYNPDIDSEKLSSEDTSEVDWCFNSHLESIIGQVNYYYNNGLRLPNLKEHTGTTSSYYEILKQNTPFTNTVVQTDEKTTILISNIDGSKEFDFTQSFFDVDNDKQLLKEYIDSATSLDLKKLGELFTASTTNPYNLFDVKLAVPNSSLNIKDNNPQTRFFALPEKTQSLIYDQYMIELNLARHINEDINDENNLSKNAVICANVEFVAQVHSNKLIEISSVNIEELGLITQIKNSINELDSINLYYKQNDNLEKINGVSIIKTNLSTITHPPVIENIKKLKINNQEKYISQIDDKNSFVSLVWDALTSGNNGYFISTKNDSFETSNNEIKLILSFNYTEPNETNITEKFPAFCNYVKLIDKDYFQYLDENSKYIYAKYLKIDANSKMYPLKEYHASIYPYCLGIELKRSKNLSQNSIFATDHTVEAYEKYLPIEYSLTHEGNEIISADRALPLMPLENQDNAEGEIQYQHVLPLVQNLNITDNRYSCIGNIYNMNFALRDIYGFRITPISAGIANYQHRYFDKLIPIDLWSNISLSFWFSHFQDQSIIWRLSAFIGEENSSPVQSSESTDDLIRNQQIALEQLQDLYVVVSFENPNINYSSTLLKDFLIKTLLESLKYLKNENYERLNDIEIPQILSEDIKQEINLSIKISRPPDYCISKPSDDILDFDLVTKSSNQIKLYQIQNKYLEENKTNTYLIKLNESIQAATNKYTLGISSGSTRKKQVFIINKSNLETLKIKEITKDGVIPKENYYGILPFSNSLWSGNYQSSNDLHLFSSVDLDVCLRNVLEKIDQLLEPQSIEANIFPPENLNDLIFAKRILIDNQLKSKIANVKDEHSRTSNFTESQFRNLLLENTNNYYNYDGIINLKIDESSNEYLKEHRLTINFKKEGLTNNIDYNFVSSKIGEGLNEWVVLFDKLENQGTINFELTPQITHIEYNIKSTEDPNDIEESTWIQLLEPISLKNTLSDTKVNYQYPDLTLKVRNWERILRVFPSKPVITKNIAYQNSIDVPGLELSTNLGKWNYQIELKDLYKVGDEIRFNLITKSSGKLIKTNENKLKGFLAYWSSQIDNTNFLLEIFVDELVKTLGIVRKKLEQNNLLDNRPLNFSIIKKSENEWVSHTKNPNLKKVLIDKNGEYINIFIKDSFNIFDVNNSILAVKPEIQVSRNSTINNSNFHYLTELVSPVFSATPNIQFNNVLKTKDMNIFDLFKDTDLPYKSTFRHFIKNTDLSNNYATDLASIPVFQMEFKPGNKPNRNIEDYFNGYENGVNSISLILYNQIDDSNLPIFEAADIRKDNSDIKS